MSEDISNKIEADMDPLKKILIKIPGFKGYLERQNRRDSDKILRDITADRLEEQYQRVSSLERDFISQGEIMYVDDLEAGAIKIRTFADRIRRASRGYAGIFDAVKINQEELDRLYEYDLALLESVDEISRAIDNIELSMGMEGLPASIRNLTTTTQEAINAYNKREEVFLGETQL
jgi:hypothetical protein